MLKKSIENLFKTSQQLFKQVLSLEESKEKTLNRMLNECECELKFFHKGFEITEPNEWEIERMMQSLDELHCLTESLERIILVPEYPKEFVNLVQKIFHNCNTIKNNFEKIYYR